MWRANITDIFGMFTGIILGLAFFLLLAFLIYLFVFKRIQMNHALRLEAIKQGVQIPTVRERYGSLKAGIVSAAVGAGLLVGLIIGAASDRDPIGGEIVIALVPLFIGVGLILFHTFWGRNLGEDTQARS